jgi:NADH-quinone oxidoreductase subunit N
LAGLTVVLVRFFPAYVDTWSGVAAAGAALTMTVGNVAALRQRHAVRLLAWSSVAQAGYLLVPLAAGGSAADVGALQAYALMYALVNLSAFAVVIAATARGAVDVDDFRGLIRSDPLLGGALAFALLCLAGLPPGVIGLLAKVVIFQSAVDADLTWLAVVMAVNVAIGLVYYLRWVAIVFTPAGPLASSAESAAGTAAEPRAASAAPTGSSAEASPVLLAERQARLGEEANMMLPVRVVVVATLVAAVVLSVIPGPLFAVIP